MNNEALFLFLILLLGLVLCSFLGGNCGKEGFDSNITSQLQTGTIFTDPSGSTITVIDRNGSKILELVQKNTYMTTILTTKPPPSITATANTFYSKTPIVFTATVVTGSDGKSTINVKLPDGKTIVFTQTSSSNNSSSFGSFFDNYNHYSGSGSYTKLQNGTVFIDRNGNNITVIVNIDGTQSLKLIQVNQTTPIIFTMTPPPSTTATANTFYAIPPLKMTATVITDGNGQSALKVTLANGQTILFTQSGSSNISSTQYYGSTGSPIQTGSTSTSYSGYYGASAGSATGPQGNTAYYAQGPQGNTVAGATTGSSYDYSSSLPPGIPRSQIPSGQADMYILKSQVVPPVCPVCPTISSSSSSNDPDKEAKCRPCPAPQRCPEPSFDCKKVPNYSVIDNQFLPQPVISDFSTFGM